MAPETAEEWWTLLDDRWDYLLEIIGHHLDFDHQAFDPPGTPIERGGKFTGRNVMAELHHLKRTRDRRMARYLHATWGLASDAYAWSVPAWGDLCDLCSEDWCLNDE